ncbi:MAG TPA: hypothetical protein VKE88_03325 [Candidatus Nanoarchaeia archaeon]|nr:hypothetical protein [Candidatus Nanoarchaeia archaeon]
MAQALSKKILLAQRVFTQGNSIPQVNASAKESHALIAQQLELIAGCECKSIYDFNNTESVASLKDMIVNALPAINPYLIMVDANENRDRRTADYFRPKVKSKFVLCPIYDGGVAAQKTLDESGADYGISLFSESQFLSTEQLFEAVRAMLVGRSNTNYLFNTTRYRLNREFVSPKIR